MDLNDKNYSLNQDKTLLNIQNFFIKYYEKKIEV